jgi:hypothetical protein
VNDIIEDRGRGFLIEIGEELSRLRAENARLTAEVAALKAKADPLAEMWRELAEYQPIADSDGHGESWRRMCSERTEAAAWAARDEAWAARDAAWAAWDAWDAGTAWTAGTAARAAAWAANAKTWASDAKTWAAEAIGAIHKAKEVQP